MKINNFRTKCAKKGDLIRFSDKAIGLVCDKDIIVLLHFGITGDAFIIQQDLEYDWHFKEFKNKNYEVIARSKDWEIVIK